MPPRRSLAIALLLGLTWGCAGPSERAPDAGPTAWASATVRAHAVRLRPGEDLRDALEQFCQERHLRAGAIVTAVGSLSRTSIRFADHSEPTVREGPFEIVSLVGTLGAGGVHLHLEVADANGETSGGHLVRGCTVYTTAEIVVAELRGLTFDREMDPRTGYRELHIQRDAR